MGRSEPGAARRPPAGLVLAALLLLLAAAVVLAASFGQVSIPVARVAGTLLRQLGIPALPEGTPPEVSILLTFRLPRVVAAAVVGAALATTGALFQGLLRNPLADPYVVGTSGGAALGSVLGILLGGLLPSLQAVLVPGMGFLGALGAMALVYQLARVGGKVPIVTVLLAGFTVSTVLGYTSSLLLILNERLQLQMARIYARLLGGIAVVGWSELAVVGPLTLLTCLAAVALARPLNALALGEEGAARLGVPVEREKRLVLAAGSLLTAAAVSISGVIGFVGLVVPHALRLVCGPDHRVLLPASALGGAVFLVLADLLARVLISGGDVPVGIVTAFLGGPFFLWLLRRTRREFEW